MNEELDRKSWLSDLSNQSWNLELLVSGAALFSTSFLPGLDDQAIEYYFQNYQANSDYINVFLPLLAYSAFKAASYLLITTFFVHFVFRAFWIALVGLRAVFPQGIIYEQLPNINDQMRDSYRKDFGSFDDYIIRLDKRCSQIFSIAFLLVIFVFFMAMAYLIGFLLIVIFKTYIPAAYGVFKKVIIVAYILYMVASIALMFLMKSEKYKNNKYVNMSYMALVNLIKTFFFGMYKPSSYISFVLSSNIPHKRFYKGMAFFGFVFIALLMYIYWQKFSDHEGMNVTDPRKHYAMVNSELIFNNNFYENKRMPDALLSDAVIQADVIDEPFIKLFINYSKRLDAGLNKVCKDPIVPDSLKKYYRRLEYDKANLACLNTYFQVSINDSIIVNNDFLFSTHAGTGSKGISSYISAENCKSGRNTLYIRMLATEGKMKGKYEEAVKIPFWYAKKQ